MKTKKFSTLFKFAAKSNLKASDGDESGKYNFYTSSTIISKKTDSAQYYDESIIFGNGGTANIHHSIEPFSTTSHCIVALKLSKDINPKFVYYYLLGNIHILERGFKGAGLKNISPKYIENIDIPILPPEEQNKIVTILDRSSFIINKREESIKLIDELLRATFLEMFGDPYFNSLKLPSDTLENLCQFITKGTTPKNEDILDFPIDNSIPFLKIYHITENGGINFNYKPSYVSLAVHNSFLNRSKVLPNDILMNIVGPPLGKIGIVPNDFNEWNINQAMVIFRPKDLISPLYLLHALRSKTLLKSIENQAVGVRQQNLSLKQCRNIKIPVPPIILQNKFESIIHIYSSLLSKFNLSLNQAIVLRNSLYQKVFTGELNFNVDFELDALIQEIDLQKKENDLSKITGDIAYLQRLIDKLNNQEFKEKDLYDKAKHGVFQLMAVKEEERKVVQEYDENSKRLKLALK